jgi:hypothetical protein
MFDAKKMDFGVWFDGRSHPVWMYPEVPPGMRRATLRDLWPGRPVLYQLQLGADAGSWLTDYVTRTTEPILRHYIRSGIPVYVKQ